MTVGASWWDDPTGRHRVRYWTGEHWSEWVADGGTEPFRDPLGSDGATTPPRFMATTATSPDGGRVAFAILVVFAGFVVAGIALLDADQGLALAVFLVACISAIRLLMPGTSPSWLPLLVPVALLGGALVSLTATRTVTPDPFGLAVGSDVVAECGSALHRGDEGYGCGDWLDRQLLHAKVLFALGVILGVAITARWFATRRGWSHR